MINIRVEYILDKAIEDVFDAITDHENYTRFSAFEVSELLETGREEKNGVGAVRLLGSGRASFKERITCFERPSKMSYHVEESRPIPMRHDRGDVMLTAVDGKTKVLWISEGQVAIPIIGGLLGRLMAPRGARAFRGILKEISAS